MTERKGKASDASGLRRKAETVLYSKQADYDSVPLITTEKLRLIHELQVHQIELEMQNEELRRAQTEIQCVEALCGTYEELYDLAPVAYFTLNPETVIISVNHAGATLLETETPELMGTPFRTFVNEPEHTAFAAFLRQVSRSTERKSCDVTLVTAHQKQVVARIEAVSSRSGRECRLVVIDITEWNNIQQERLKLQKLQSLGVLAGGIAHNFNNILTGVLGYILLARKYLAASRDADLPLAQAEKAALRGAGLVKQLLTFAKGGQPIKTTVSVRQCVEASAALVLTGSNVNCVIDIPDNILSLEADEGLLNQAFNNIIINATQAMPGGGTLTISAHNITQDDSNPLSLAAGPYVRFSFADTGCGMPDELLKKIFDPYFTTKLEGHGLGLASCHSIISKHGGHISVRSKPGFGTTFDIVLPATNKKPVPTAPDLVFVPEVEVTGRSILVMDDEEFIRDLAATFWANLGYQVQTCSNGEEAVALYKAAKEAGTPFSAAIMDLIIPGGMGGQDAAQLILKIDPQARLIVSSGYFNDPVMADYKAYGFCGTLPKPFSIPDIAKMMADLEPEEPKCIGGVEREQT